MISINDSEIESLPEDPEQAFITFERIIRARYEEACRSLGNYEPTTEFQRQYMSRVLPAAKHYNIAELADWNMPTGQENGWNPYNSFMENVEFCITTLRLRTIERDRQYVVALDGATKAKLRYLLEQIREQIEALDISAAKKDRLNTRITALEDEINRERTRYKAFAALMIEACDDFGKAANALEPVVRLIERVGAAIGVAKRSEENQPRLPPRREPKQIEPPKENKKKLINGLDDEAMPF